MASFATRHSRTALLSAPSRCSRYFASSTPSYTSKNQPDKAGPLLNLLDNVASEVAARDEREIAQGNKNKLKFEKAIVPPYEYSREAFGRTTSRGFPPLGPGRKGRYKDIFVQCGIDPRREVHNEALMSFFMTRLGKIKPRNVTGLSQRSQRLVGKAIKRAKMMGVVPMFSNSKLDRLQVRSNGSVFAESEDISSWKDESPATDAVVKEDDKK